MRERHPEAVAINRTLKAVLAEAREVDDFEQSRGRILTAEDLKTIIMDSRATRVRRAAQTN